MAQHKSYTKNPASIKQQIDTLISRGCIINDKDYAEKCLTNINYYRLAHYSTPFLKEKGKYEDGTTFEAIMQVYNFDRLLRRLIMTYLEEIEISLRAILSNYHALKYGALGYLNGSTFDSKHNHQAFLSKIDRLMETNDKEDFVIHHKKKYGGVMPVWAAFELFSFGTLAYFFIDMKNTDQKEIAEKHYGLNYRTLEDRLMCISDLRNACAHYTRLYQNPFPFAPKSSEGLSFTADDTLYTFLECARSLYPDKDKWDYEFTAALNELIVRFDMSDKMRGYGFPD